MKTFPFAALFVLIACLSAPSAMADTMSKTVTIDPPVEKNTQLPAGWELKKWSGDPVIAVERENGSPLLRMTSRASSFGVGKEVRVNAQEFPYLRWNWKITKLPEAGDVRAKDTNDQAAQIYLVFPRFPAAVNSRVIGYIWDSNAPEGLKTDSPVSSNIKYIVVRSGKGSLGKWVQETRNVYQDYRDLFGEEPPMMEKVFLMIDSDNTRSVAECYFDDISFQKRAVASLP